MAKAEKLNDRLYRTEDGAYQLAEYEGQWLVQERRGNRWVTVGTQKTVAAAQKELTRVTKTEEEVPEVEVEAPVEEETE